MAAVYLLLRAGQRFRVVPDVLGVDATAIVTRRRTGEVDGLTLGQITTAAVADFVADIDGLYTVTDGTLQLVDIGDVMASLDATVVYTYTATGKIATEAWTADSATYTKTYTYDGATDLLASESAWAVS